MYSVSSVGIGYIRVDRFKIVNRYFIKTNSEWNIN